MKKVIIRTDAGAEVGFGHAMRSIALAKYLRKHVGIEAVFYSNPYDHLENLYNENHFSSFLNDGLDEIEFLQQIGEENPKSILLIDKLYPYNSQIISSLRSKLKIIMLQNECEGMFESDYAVFPAAHLSETIIQDERWQNSSSKLLYGPDYVLINEQVIKIAQQCKKENTTKPYIVVTTGASDPNCILIQILNWLNESEITVDIKALVGFDFQYNAKLDAIVPKLKRTIEIRKFDYKYLFSSRLAISAFGVTTNELIYANIPVITFGHIKRNSLSGEMLQQRFGCNCHLGLFEEVSKDQFLSTVKSLWFNEKAFKKLKRNQKDLIDGNGMKRLSLLIKKLMGKENY